MRVIGALDAEIYTKLFAAYIMSQMKDIVVRLGDEAGTKEVARVFELTPEDLVAGKLEAERAEKERAKA